MTWRESEPCNLILGEYRGKNVCGENTHKPRRTLVPKAGVIQTTHVKSDGQILNSWFKITVAPPPPAGQHRYQVKAPQ